MDDSDLDKSGYVMVSEIEDLQRYYESEDRRGKLNFMVSFDIKREICLTVNEDIRVGVGLLMGHDYPVVVGVVIHRVRSYVFMLIVGEEVVELERH